VITDMFWLHLYKKNKHQSKDFGSDAAESSDIKIVLTLKESWIGVSTGYFYSSW